MKNLGLTALVFCLVLGVVEADIITVQVTAEITQFEDNGGYFDGSISVGTLLTMTYSYDTEVSGIAVSSGLEYEQFAPNLINISIGNYEFQNSGSFFLYIENGVIDQFQLGATVESGSLPESNLSMMLYDTDGTALSTDLLPEINYNLNDWYGFDIDIDGGREFSIEMDIKSISIIPEPATIFILSIGGLFVRRYNKIF
jgi:hypothetical protein